jgi:hypothetical protein
VGRPFGAAFSFAFCGCIAAFRLANRRVKAIVSHDAQAYVKQQTDQVEWLQRTDHVYAWVGQVQHMVAADATRARGPPKVLLDCKGEHVYSLKVVLVHFSEHFVGVLGGGKDLKMRCGNN